MQAIDQNNAVNSMEQALIAPAGLIDGRSEKDWLCFLSDFASLINFYDNNNIVRGNWAPFLAKDPVFLLAVISKTPYSVFYLSCTNLFIQLEKLLKNTHHAKEISHCLNQLFDRLTEIFMYIKQWVYYMQASAYEYALKTHVIQQVKTVFSRYFWALISLQQNLFLSEAIKDIKPVDHSRIIFFESYDELIWKLNKDKSPYWEILELHYPIKKNSTADFIHAVTKVGHELLTFFNQVIAQSAAEFEIQKIQKSKYPDTLLLRTFVDLLKIHQEQLNGITHRHLQFYFKDILKQDTLPAIADKVFICAAPAKKDDVFNLPAATLFDAGQDADNNPVLFSTQESVNLNPAEISQVYTLAIFNGSNKRGTLYLQSMPNPGIVNKTQDGNIQSWETFGGENALPELKVRPAIAFASPLLLLKEGQRNISLKLHFTKIIDQQLFNEITVYLSTQTSWLAVPIAPQFFPDANGNSKEILVSVELDPGQPAIEPFLKHPDGLVSLWPMVKIEFDSVLDFAVAPVVSALDIAVDVTGIKTFQLYNDNGMLSTKMPYPLFGPAALLNSNFIIGSNEIFSKPVNALYIQLQWDKLPDFLLYYQQYNNYIQQQELLQAEMNKTFFTKVKDFIVKPFLWVAKWVKRVFGKKKCSPPAFKNQYNNICFKADFAVLQDQLWKQYKWQKTMPFVIENNKVKTEPYRVGENCCPKAEDTSDLLFSTGLDDCQITQLSVFALESDDTSKKLFDCDPALQQLPLKFTDRSTSGFMKMSLSGNDFGFGSGIYPNVVSYVALNNARELSKAALDDEYKPHFMEPANLPFVPKLTNLTGHYTASFKYDFTVKKEAYPLQCFLYSPFSNYTIYNSGEVVDNTAYTMYELQEEQNTIFTGLPLFHTAGYGGCLLLGMDDLIPDTTINIYFELVRKHVVSASPRIKGCFYLGIGGWKALSLLSDGTNNFACTGIIKLSVPADIDSKSNLMPGGKFWIAITTTDDPSLFSKTVFVKTNGIEAVRTGNTYLNADEAPRLAAGTIKKLHTAIPQVSVITQPFASFGGKAAESEVMMHRRISNTIKTKGRVVSTDDYFRLIKQEFNDIYFSKTVYNKHEKYIGVYVVKAVESTTDPHAFNPLVSECKETAIKYFLKERAAAFYDIRVSNFNLQPVQVTASVLIKPGFQSQAVETNINSAINFFLSPWITGNGKQTTIDTAITGAAMAALIKCIDGVENVYAVNFKTCKSEGINFKMPEDLPAVKTVIPMAENYLMISGMNHIVEWTSK